MGRRGGPGMRSTASSSADTTAADRHQLKALAYSHTAGYQQDIRARQARCRCHPTVTPGVVRTMRVNVVLLSG